MISLRHRSLAPELMDGDDVSPQEFAACIEDLARVNTVTLARPPTLAFIREALRATPATRKLTIVDVGYGAGDMLQAIARVLARGGREARLIGYDINPRSEPVARRLAPEWMGIDFRTGDALAMADEEPVDIVVSSLVTHHMADDEIVRFLRWMERRCTLGWLVNDLHRQWISWYGFSILSAATRWHPFVKHDGPLSIARAFTRADWNELLESANLKGRAKVQWKFPFRYCVRRTKW